MTRMLLYFKRSGKPYVGLPKIMASVFRPVLLVWFAALLVTACTTAPVVPTGNLEFRPERYFLGQMHSGGRLSIGSGSAKNLSVESSGRADGPGALKLDQTVRRAGRPDTRRQWSMRRLVDGTYHVTLSEAVGPVQLVAEGSRVHLRYRMKGGPLPVTIEQWMDLQEDGRTVHNVGTIRVLGVPVGHLDETIIHDPF